MEINNINNSSTATQALSQNILNSTGMGRDAFLRLLIEQMKNQDPLSPMDSQDFASQLAQFSSLEQLQSINENLDQGIQIDILLTQAINNTMSANFIGKSLKAVGNTLAYSGDGEMNLAFRLNSETDHLKVKIKNDAGQVIRTIEVKNPGSGDQTVTWNGQIGRASCRERV